jgi:UDP-N-acetylglucosamine 4,6-dehydratase
MNGSILITGGTGSFGRAFTRWALDNTVSRIVIYSRGEHAQAEMASDLGLRFPADRVRFFIGDVRDKDRLRRALEGVSVLVHAAALKRIETAHYNPMEVVKTNVFGAMNVIEAAHDAGVGRVVALSTDKAWKPVSAYGHSKAMAECLFLQANETRGAYGPTHTVVRYGNVSGSKGSVIPKWRAMVERGETVLPVTDPDATRFWMLLEEAVQLVVDAIDDKHAGKLLIPELPAYCLADLAKAVGASDIRITGLPEWEKPHEGLDDGITSDIARRMTISEIQEGLKRCM